MQLRFLGGAGSVSGAKVLIEHAGHRLLVDCGLFQGLKQWRLRNWSALPVPAGSIDAVILTHAHIDHCGYLPRLVEMGFKGSVFVTPATADLCRLLLPEAGRLQENEAQFANQRGFSKHAPALPLYTEASARRALDHLQECAFGASFEPAPGIAGQLQPSGHVIGAASVLLHVGEHSLLFSGDLGSYDDLVMRRPQPPEGADYVLLESTYGRDRHRMADALSRLAKLINRAAARGGVVLVSAHAAGRAQLFLRAIGQLEAAARIPALPVHLNSPVVAEATSLYLHHPDEHRLSPDDCAALLQRATVAHTDEEVMSLNDLVGPAIVVAAEGVANGARVTHHIKAYAPDARNVILFTGHQAAGTRGTAMLGGAAQVKIHGDWVHVRADVCELGALSGHADRQDLLEWVGALPRAPRHVYLMHGEPEAADSLRQAIAERHGWPCSTPEYMDLINV